MGMGIGIGIGVTHAQHRGVIEAQVEVLPFTLLLQHELTHLVDRNNEGAIIRAISIPWLEIYYALKKDPDTIVQFSEHPERFEEFIAASYQREGWEKVILTPRSGDGGRDVIAEKGGFGAIRILDQCKAFRRGHLVGQTDVRAMLGVLHSDANASKAVISTSSDFAPGIASDQSIQKFVPNRLELRNGKQLVDWLSTIEDKK